MSQGAKGAKGAPQRTSAGEPESAHNATFAGFSPKTWTTATLACFPLGPALLP